MSTKIKSTKEMEHRCAKCALTLTLMWFEHSRCFFSPSVLARVSKVNTAGIRLGRRIFLSLFGHFFLQRSDVVSWLAFARQDEPPFLIFCRGRRAGIFFNGSVVSFLSLRKRRGGSRRKVFFFVEFRSKRKHGWKYHYFWTSFVVVNCFLCSFVGGFVHNESFFITVFRGKFVSNGLESVPS